MNPDDNLFYAFLLTLLAGLSTGVGAMVAFSKYAKKENFLAFIMGLAAGAMIYISFFELIFGALEFLTQEENFSIAFTKVTFVFLGSFMFLAILDAVMKWVAKKFGYEDFGNLQITPDASSEDKSKKLYRSGIIIAVALAIHNLPEGLVTFLTTLQDLNLGIGMAIAIAMHNIPEGMAVAIPIYHATNSKKKAVLIALIPGVFEPIGAGLAYLIFLKDFDQQMFEYINVFVAAIMIYISFFELLPTAFELNKKRYVKWGLTIGMIVMGTALVLLT